MSAAKATTNHDEIRRWVEARGGRPAVVKGTGRGKDPGILRVDYPGYAGEDTLQTISWDDWLEAFEANKLALLTDPSPRSRFSKLVSRGSIATGRRGSAAKRTGAQRSTAKRSAAKRSTAKRGAAKRGAIAKRGAAAAERATAAAPKRSTVKRSAVKRGTVKRARGAEETELRGKATAKRGGAARTTKRPSTARSTRKTTPAAAARTSKRPAAKKRASKPKA